MTPDLETDRLLLRRFAQSDVDFVFDMYARAEVQRYIGDGRAMADRDEAVTRVARWSAFDHAGHGIWLITDRTSGERFGSALLKIIPASSPDRSLPPSGETEVGWHLHPDAWGRGIASEAAERMLAFSFAAGHDHVIAVTHPKNSASQAVARRVGLIDRGLTDRYYDTTCRLFRTDRPV